MQIIKVRFRTNAELESSLDRDQPHGGMFCPTTSKLEENEQVIVELSAPILPNKVLIRGRVKSWRPALPRLRVRAGATVAFDPEETDKMDFLVETLTGKRGETRRRRHTRLPVAVPVRFRAPDQADFSDSELTEISVGGAMLSTHEPIPLDSEVILEITPPGAVSPIAISGKATYHRPGGATGLRFIYRDSGGSRRLRELVRRLKEA